MTGRLTVRESLHGLPSVEMTRATPKEMALVRSAVTRNHMDDPIYRLRKDAEAFLQGFDERSGWCLVEFWTKDAARYMPFVDYLNSELECVG